MANWLSKIADIDTDLRSIGVAPDVIQFVKSQPQPNWFVHVLKKQPQLDINTLQQTVKPPQKQSPYTLREINFCRQFKPTLGDWPLVQLRKLRMSGEKTQQNENDEDNYGGWSMALLSNFLHQIADWFRAAKRQNPQIQISSYTFEQARNASREWHREMARKGENAEYEATNQAHVVYGPKWQNNKFDGWTIQKVISPNDLWAEGNKMDHCVGDYCERVETGESTIYSLRDPKNRPHVTIEMQNNSDRPTVTQVQGKRNSRPNDLYKAMVSEWLSTLNGQVQLDPSMKTHELWQMFEKLNRLTREDVFDTLEKKVYEPTYGLTPSFGKLDGKLVYDRLLPHITHDDTGDPKQESMAIQRMADDYAKIIWKAAKDSITDLYWRDKPHAEQLADWYDKASDFLEDITRNGAYPIIVDFIPSMIFQHLDTERQWKEYVKTNPEQVPPGVVEMLKTPFQQSRNGQFLFRVQEAFKQLEQTDPLPIEQYAAALRNSKPSVKPHQPQSVR